MFVKPAKQQIHAILIGLTITITIIIIIFSIIIIIINGSLSAR